MIQGINNCFDLFPKFQLLKDEKKNLIVVEGYLSEIKIGDKNKLALILN